MNDTNHSQEDIDVTTSTGLEVFWSYITATYREIGVWGTHARHGAAFTAADSLYRDLETLITHCREVLRVGNHLSDEDIEALQAGYDHLLALLDQVSEQATAPTVPTVVESSQRQNSGHSLQVTSADHAPTLPTETAHSTPAMMSSVSESSPAPRIHHAPLPVVQKEDTKRFSTGPFAKIIESLSKISRYQEHIEKSYASRSHLETVLKREVERIEQGPLRGFYTVLGFKFENAFYTLLMNMTIPEAVAFDDQPRAVIRQTLKEADIKYEVYVEWVDSLVVMLERTHAHADMTIGELFVRNFFEEQIAKQKKLEEKNI